MKVLVTGSTGFIGNYVIEELLKNNVSVIATSRSVEKAKKNSWFNKVTFIPYDISVNSDEDLFSFFGNPDSMIHLAWEGLPNYNEAFHKEENLTRHILFLTNLVTNGLQNLNVTGTCFEYGKIEGKLSENMEPKPHNPYADAKNKLRIYLENLQEEIPFSLKWMRLFYTFGKGQNEKSLFSLLDKALDNEEETFNMSGGEQIRDFLPVEEMAEIIVKLSSQVNQQGIFNVCSGRQIMLKDFVTEYLNKKNKKITLNLGYYPYPDYEAFRFWGDNKKLKTL